MALHKNTQNNSELQAWLKQTCAMLPELKLGAIFQNHTLTQTFPEHAEATDIHLKTAKLATQQKSPVSGVSGDELTVAYPINSNTILVVQLARSIPEANVYRLLNWAVSWLELMQSEQDKFISDWSSTEVHTQLSSLAKRFRLKQVLLVSWRDQQARTYETYPKISPANQSSIEQAATLLNDKVSSKGLLIPLEHSGLSLYIPEDALPSEGLSDENHKLLVRFVTLIDLQVEWSRWQTLTPLNQLKDTVHRGLQRLTSNRLYWMGPTALVLFGLFFLETDRYVKVPAVIAAKQKQVIAAPFDGYIESAKVKQGDFVKEDDVLASLDGRDLTLKRDAISAQKKEREQSYRSALTKRDLPAAQMMRAQLEQVEAQQLLLNQQLEQLELRSPLTGIVLSGDPSKSIGAPIKQGEILFEVAREGEFELVLKVPEYRIRDVGLSQTGELALNAFPFDTFGFEIRRVGHFFEHEPGIGTQFKVHAELQSETVGLLPGMAGTARIRIGKQSIARLFFGDLLDWLWIQRRRLLPW